MKAHTTITMDAEVLQKARAMGLNVSRLCNEYIRQYAFGEDTQASLDVKLEIAKEELQSIDSKKKQAEAIVNELESQKQMMDNEEYRLKKAEAEQKAMKWRLHNDI